MKSTGHFLGYCPSCGARVFGSDQEIQVEDYCCCDQCGHCGRPCDLLDEPKDGEGDFS